MIVADWRKYRNFSKYEFDCKHTGKNLMRTDFMELLQQIRNTYGKPMIVTSGFRHHTHPVERSKRTPGEHTYGVAADIAVEGTNAMDLIVISYGYGVRRIGINQKGDARFVHLGIGDRNLEFPEALWTY